ncbi:9796_t:CDS:1, partial [Cetraspora pellucida]
NGKLFTGITTKLRSTLGKNLLLVRKGFELTYRDDDVAFVIPEHTFMQKLNDPSLSRGSIISEAHGKFASDLTKSAMILSQSKVLELRQVYSRYASPDEQQTNTSTIHDVTCYVFKTDKPEPAQLLATIMYVVKESAYFIPNISAMRNHGQIILRPKSDVAAITKVLELIRLRDPSVAEFQSKAQKIVNYIRSNTNDSSTEYFTSQVDTLPKFTDRDKLFINFIRTFILNSQTSHGLFETPIAAILKPMKLYDCDLDKSCATQFLREIGVWSPWENLNVYDSRIMLNGHGISKKSDNDQVISLKLATKLMNTKPFVYKQKKQSKSSVLIKSPLKLGPMDFYPYDICENIRHDFGKLPVYTIDDYTAHEIDDGVSIERLDGTDSDLASMWIHVHVADPSTYIPPGHKLSQVARTRVQSIYFPDRNYSMLPSTTNEKRFSLGVGAKDRGSCVLTFSMRIGNDGTFLDYKVRPGIVRRVKSLYYDDVDTVLSWDNIGRDKEEIEFFHKQRHFHPREIPTPKKTREKFSSSEKQDLLYLQKLAVIHMRRRISLGSFMFMLPQPSIELYPSPLPISNPDPQAPIIHTGIPIIQVGLDKSMHSPARAMVAELMVMAGIVASKFCQERDIPILYRRQDPPNSPIIEEELKNIDLKNGALPITSTVKVRPLMSTARLTTNPGAHWAMGIHEGYSKVTSPLRRYCDIVAHWQMKAALLDDTLPFTKDELENMALHVRAREKDIGKTQMLSSKFWILNLINRFKEAGTLPELTGVVLNAFENGHKNVLVRELGVHGMFHDDKGTVNLGDTIKVYPAQCDPENTNLFLRLL